MAAYLSVTHRVLLFPIRKAPLNGFFPLCINLFAPQQSFDGQPTQFFGVPQ